MLLFYISLSSIIHPIMIQDRYLIKAMPIHLILVIMAISQCSKMEALLPYHGEIILLIYVILGYLIFEFIISIFSWVWNIVNFDITTDLVLYDRLFLSLVLYRCLMLRKYRPMISIFLSKWFFQALVWLMLEHSSL